MPIHSTGATCVDLLGVGTRPELRTLRTVLIPLSTPRPRGKQSKTLIKILRLDADSWIQTTGTAVNAVEELSLLYFVGAHETNFAESHQRQER